MLMSCVASTSLLVSTGAVSCYPAPMVNLIWNATILQARCASALSYPNMRKSNYPHRCVNVIAFHISVAATVKLQKFVISEPDFSPSEQGSNWQHQLRLSSLYPWHIMTSALRH